jgi:hypothetical protein
MWEVVGAAPPLAKALEDLIGDGDAGGTAGRT